jgi:hypothetical protein
MSNLIRLAEMAKPYDTSQANVTAPSAEGLARAAMAASEAQLAQGGAATGREGGARRGPPPVHLWNPPYCGDLDIRIRRDGSWHYLGTPIGREGLVRLFASILRLEGGRHFLVTPAEKVGITVEDAPFVAVDAEAGEGADGDDGADGPALIFTTNVGDRVVAGPDHPIRVQRSADGTVVPYVMVRHGLEARIDRKTFYRLVDRARVAPGPDGAPWLGWHSGGAFFALMPEEEAR